MPDPPTDLDGPLLQHAVIAASQAVIQLQQHLNDINVFPVADADTGTNLALTLRSAAEGALNCKDTSVSQVSAASADAALQGAHGCSGAIVAQFLQGLSVGFQGVVTADLPCFARAARMGAALARDAVAEPRDGTILTVMHDWADFVEASVGDSSDLLTLLSRSLVAATASLRKTPDKLETLAAAGVVDAGARGFVAMLEGFVGFLQSGRIDPGLLSSLADRAARPNRVAPTPIDFGFCTQTLIVGPSIDRTALRRRLQTLGDSMIVAGSAERVHLHIHTSDPERVFTIAREYGGLVDPQVEDMREQRARARHRQHRRTIALITDSACDLPADEIISHNIRVVPMQIVFGGESYLDKVTVTDEDFYRLLATSPFHPTTSQPSPADFRATFLRAAANQHVALAITVSAALSGTFQSAVAAAEDVRAKIDVAVVDSKNISAGLGLILREAADAIASGRTIQEVRRRADWAVQNVRIFATVETVEHLVRGGRLSRAGGRLARMLHIKPVLALNRDGRVQVVAKAFTAARSRRKLMKIVERAAAGKRDLRFIVAHANAPMTATRYVDHIRRSFEAKELSVVPLSAAFGAHAGPGAVAVAFLGTD